MNKYEIVRRIEEFAPLNTQEDWDLSGWLVEIEGACVNKVMFALTVTESVFKQVQENECDMIISHHPLFYIPYEYKQINIYCAHTNLDRAEGGTTDFLMEKLGLKKTGSDDYVRIVELKTPITAEDLREKLSAVSKNLRYVNNYNVGEIKTIGFCAGSGSEFIGKTDAFVTGDLKFHTALEAKTVIFDIGHFESEIFTPELLQKISKAENFIIAKERSPFIY